MDAKFTERYVKEGRFVLRKVVFSDGHEVINKIGIPPSIAQQEDEQSLFDYCYLRLKEKPEQSHKKLPP